MNKVILIGRLGADPEVRYTQTGKAVTTFSLAVTRRRAEEGQPEITDWPQIVCWEKLAEICGNNLTKGRRISVEGRLQGRTYETQEGQKRRVFEVVAQNIEFLDSRREEAPHSAERSGAEQFGPSMPEEDIPF